MANLQRDYEKINDRIIKPNEDEEVTERLQVPGGWIVRIRGRKIDINNRKNDHMWESERFIKDPDHNWSLI